MSRASRSTPRRSARGIGWEAWVEMGTDSIGKRVRRHVRGETRQVVATRIAELEAQRASGGGCYGGPVPTVDEWLSIWVEGRALEVRPSTLKGYRTDLRYISTSIGRTRLDRLDPEDVERLWRDILSSGRSGGTVAHVRRTLSAALATAVRRGRISRNPVMTAAVPRYVPDEVVPLTTVETRAVPEAATRTRHSARWGLALAFGLRQGECLALCWNDVDWEQGTLTVRRSLSRRIWQHGCEGMCHRKRGADCPKRHNGGLVFDETKTRSSIRTLSLPPALLSQLRSGRAAQSAERLAAGELWSCGPHNGWVFATPLGRPVDPRSDWERWKTLLPDAGVREARLHDARHTAATGLLVLGVDARTVMRLLGWSQLSLTARYQHVVPELVEEAGRRVGNHLWGTP